MNRLEIRKVHGETRGGDLVAYIRPFRKAPRANDLVIQADNFVAGRRPRVIARVPRSKDDAADQAVADTIVTAFEVADGVRQLLRDGAADAFGTFTYTPAPRIGADAIARLQQLLEVTPPRHFRAASAVV